MFSIYNAGAHLDSVLYSMRARRVTICEAVDRARTWRIQGSTWRAFRGMLNHVDKLLDQA